MEARCKEFIRNIQSVGEFCPVCKSMASTALIIGIVLIFIGIIMLIIGIVLYNQNLPPPNSTVTPPPTPLWVWFLIIGGIIFLIVGIILLIWGWATPSPPPPPVLVQQPAPPPPVFMTPQPRPPAQGELREVARQINVTQTETPIYEERKTFPGPSVTRTNVNQGASVVPNPAAVVVQQPSVQPII